MQDDLVKSRFCFFKPIPLCRILIGCDPAGAQKRLQFNTICHSLLNVADITDYSSSCPTEKRCSYSDYVHQHKKKP